MPVHHGIVDVIGNTRLIRRRRASDATGCTILGEGRVHESRPVRQGPAALGPIREAEHRDLLRTGGYNGAYCQHHWRRFGKGR